MLVMRPHTEREIYSLAAPAVVFLLFCGLLLAYGATAAGIIGLLSSWHVAFYAITGSAISFLGTVGYFFIGDARIRARLSRLNDLNDPSGAVGN